MALNRWPKDTFTVWELKQKDSINLLNFSWECEYWMIQIFAITLHQWPQKHGIYWFQIAQNKSDWVDELKNIEWMNN